MTTVIRETQSVTALAAPPGEGDVDQRRMFLQNEHSFLLIRRQVWSSVSSATETLTPVIRETPSVTVLPAPPEEAVVGDTDKRSFLKIAGIAGAGLVASQLFPNKASALIMGSSPTTGVVGVKNASNVRINPAREETLNEVLKTTDLALDAGVLQVKVTSVAGEGSSSFSDSIGTPKSGRVDDTTRNVWVDVKAIPSTASTEGTLQTISFGHQFALRLATAGDVDYVGEAEVGTAPSATGWRIKKVDSTTGVSIQWASGTAGLDKIWDSRTSYTYS